MVNIKLLPFERIKLFNFELVGFFLKAIVLNVEFLLGSTLWLEDVWIGLFYRWRR
jgi:hypothetical protein